MKTITIEDYRQSAAYIRERLTGTPVLAVVLGSGLDAFVSSDRVKNKTVIPYREIPGFPVSTVSYQKGELIAGTVGERYVLFFNGRFHYYEGWEMKETAYPVVISRLLGVKGMILTNAAGGINPEKTQRGDIVMITDHIKFAPESPDRGQNLPELGERFFDMQSVYDKTFQKIAHECARDCGFSLKEGVYAYMTGPQFETPAEIRALRLLGADLVGLSTVAEVIEAAHCGVPVLGLSCVTNLAAGVTGEPMSEEEVLETGRKTAERFCALLGQLLLRLPIEK